VDISDAARRYEDHLRDTRTEYRAWLVMLPRPVLARHLSRGAAARRGLVDGGIADLIAGLPRLAAKLRVDLRELSPAARSELVRALAEAQFRVDREDRDFAWQLLEQRRRDDFGASAEAIVADLELEPDP
jgi:hypothetical protein